MAVAIIISAPAVSNVEAQTLPPEVPPTSRVFIRSLLSIAANRWPPPSVNPNSGHIRPSRIVRAAPSAARGCREEVAPQVELEPTTLRLTATQVHRKTSPWWITKSPYTLRYLANR